MVSQKKLSIVSELNQLLSSKPNLAVVKMEEKVSHQKLEQLRRELKKFQAVFKVIKNSLFEKSVNQLAASNKILQSLKKNFLPLKEKNALLLFDEDWSPALKSVQQFIEKEKSLAIKFALLDKTIFYDKEATVIARLPAKKQIIANIAGYLQSPFSRLVYSIKFHANKFVYLLNSMAKKS